MTDRFAEIVGHRLPITLLRAALQKGRIAPAYLFVGMEGIGKSLVAQAFVASYLHKPITNHPDVLWVEPTYQDKGKLITLTEAETMGVHVKGKAQIRIEQIRAITDFLSHPPLCSDRSFVIVTDAHTMAETSANALLKTLEEPGKGTILLISAHTLLPTILSRCHIIPFAPLAKQEVETVLHRLGYHDIPAPIIDLAGGSPQKAITAWQQLQTIPPALLTTLQSLPLSLISALTIAKQISQTYDLDTQIWLLEYLQQILWQRKREKSRIEKLEQAKQWLRGFVTPRLVWEITLA
ncbi:MAG: DNA polymerase III subunit delta' [Pseudanabaenaceae cyanobacterium]